MSMSNDRLGQTFNFTEEDLFYNRQGTLSPQQQKVQAKFDRGCFLLSLIVTLLFIAITLIFAIAFGTTGLVLTIMLVIFSVGGVVFTYAVWTSRNPNLPVHLLEGQPRLNISHSHHGPKFTMNIKGYEFSVNEDAYNALEESNLYRVYYTIADGEDQNLKSAVKDVVSIEKLV